MSGQQTGAPCGHDRLVQMPDLCQAETFMCADCGVRIDEEGAEDDSDA